MPTSFHPPMRTLMGPGPSEPYPRVLEAISRPTLGHLDPLFISMMDEVKSLLQSAFQTKNDLCTVISGPGSAGMEACFVNLVEPGDKVIVLQNGFFGARMREMAERCGGQVISIDGIWGRALEPGRLEDTLKSHPDTKIVAFVHAETSTGVLNDAKTLAEIAHQHGCLTIVDTVTSLGGVPLHVDDWRLDAVFSAGQKCLGCIPGLAPLTFGPAALDKIARRKSKVRSWFMDVTQIMTYWSGNTKRAYHHTAPINSLYGMHEALTILHEEGLEARWTKYRELQSVLCQTLTSMGLTLSVPEPERLPQLTAVSVPPGADEAGVRKLMLNDYNIEIGAGLGASAGKIWRIGLMGHGCSLKNITLCTSALGAVIGASNSDRSTQAA